MKHPTLSMLLLMLMFALFACKSEDEPAINGIPIPGATCNSYKNSPDTLSIPGNQSCVYYQYDPATKQLTLNHINAGFNCCPGTVYYNPTIGDSLITIHEFETSGLCDCSCLYDLNMILPNIEAQSFTVKFMEPYQHGQAELIFAIDLENDVEGYYCVSRDNYPWGIYQ